MACHKSSETSNVVTNIERSLTDKLRLALSTTCEKFISYIKFSLMKKNFREIYKDNPEALKDIHGQLCSQLKNSITEDLDDLCEKHCTDFLLNSLEALKKNQESSLHSWRPSGDPKEDLRDHIYPLKLKHKEDLQAILTKLQLCNEELVNEVCVNHADILHLTKCNDDLHGAFSNIISSFIGTNLENLEEVYYTKIRKI